MTIDKSRRAFLAFGMFAIKSPLSRSSVIPLRDAPLSSDNTRKVNLEDVRGSKVFKATDFGARFNDSTDDTAAIQAAINAANAHTVNGFFGGVVLLPSGIAHITSTITLRAGAYLISESRNPRGCIIEWDGAAGGTMFSDPSTGETGLLLDGITFRAGTTTPDIQLDLPSADWHLQIRNCHFEGANVAAIYAPHGWINFHIRDARFDGINGYAIHLIPDPTQDGSCFTLDKFTYDNAGTTAASGILLIENTVSNASNIGVVEIANARIEINSRLTDPAGLITINSPAVSPNVRIAQASLRNIFYVNAGGGSNDALFWSNRSGGGIVDAAVFVIQNLSYEKLSAVTHGFYVEDYVALPDSGYIPFMCQGAGRIIPLVEDALRFQSHNSSQNCMVGYSGSEANARWKFDADGTLTRGPGGGTAPVTLFLRGMGSPEGSITAGAGSLYQREDGRAGTSLYVKETSSGNTGWKALVGV
jgi:hypothetical protein